MSVLAAASDGWLGTPALPGYRAGTVVARLHDLPAVAPEHLYLDLLLMDEGGRIEDNHSGPCTALARARPPQDRRRFVRVAAELVRHAALDAFGWAATGHALAHLRANGIATPQLVTAAQLLDAGCSEHAVVASLVHLLDLVLGEADAAATMRDVAARLGAAATMGIDAAYGQCLPPRGEVEAGERGLAAQVSQVVRVVGKSRARQYLREVTDCEMLPTPALLGL